VYWGRALDPCTVYWVGVLGTCVRVLGVLGSACRY
jgi:hypothetical protein